MHDADELGSTWKNKQRRKKNLILSFYGSLQLVTCLQANLMSFHREGQGISIRH
jgi:hypothetical protein